ncbi:ubiquitin specific peptidase 25 [Phyllostomus discolor]|uniref:ubiquitinyl hydrolase 1 n=1 Tax=Phyllostomus discolor TaxID=89673 RepID=A0A834EIT0_9CHIR|nr:ubiquitin specific peptidase 25 [Phyllostomus discolor]
MTVEQNVLQQSAAQKHQQTFLNQLREITGINDTQILQQALKDSNGNLELAVAFLTAKNAKTPQQEETTYYQTALPGNDRYISVGSQADTNVIDLTGDDKDDLQRAIALSLAESNRAFRETGITDEEQAISRVLEASIAENKACLKKTPTEVWRDSRNPYDRKRQDKAPVGLKNVGNTCWFSAVIQSLFNLLEFRRLVLNYKPPSNAQDLPRNQKEHRNLPFMRELRYLFALLVGTKRKYVDPSRAVEILKDAFKSNDSQQDWHQDYRKFRETTMYLINGLENFQKESYIGSLLFLICAYQSNKELLSKGPYRGHDEELISHYRRECLLKLNEQAAEMFESGEDCEVNNGLIIMNEFIVPFLPLLLVDEMEEKDILAVEDMRNRWCSYLGQEMESSLQEKLTDFLPKLLDCSTEIKGFQEPPKIPPYSTHELCERFAQIMLSLSRTPADGR